MIKSFAEKHTEKLYNGERNKIDPSISRIAIRKLKLLSAASVLEDLRIPPGNRLEILRGNRLGQYSIRINDQWRICFVWKEEGPHEVEIVDYH